MLRVISTGGFMGPMRNYQKYDTEPHLEPRCTVSLWRRPTKRGWSAVIGAYSDLVLALLEVHLASYF